ALPREPRRIVRMVELIQRQPALALAAEAFHPARRIRREPHPRLLAVVADVDAGSKLLFHDVTDGRLALARERRGINRLAAILLHQQVAKRRWTGKAADVRGQDPLLAPFHESSVRAAIVTRRDVTAGGRRAAPCR